MVFSNPPQFVSFRFLTALLLGFILSFPAAAEGKNWDLSGFEEMPNAVLLEEDLVGGGPPTESALEYAARHGFKTVIDLRLPEEGTAETQAQAEALGLEYHSVRVTPRTLGMWQADEIAEILRRPKNRPAILHCGSGNRVGAVWALYSYKYRNMKPDGALEEGTRAGLRGPSLKETVRNLMEKE